MGTVRRWKTFGLLALVGLCLSWLISCSPSQPSSSTSAEGNVEVEFWTMQLQPQFTDYFNELIASFEQENPGIQVKWVDVPWGDMQSKILTAVSAGTAPDVVNLNPDFAAQLAGRNAWLNLDDHIDSVAREQYLPRIWEANQLDGQTFGIPWYLTTSVAMANTQLLQQAGIAAPPSTYEELADVARQVRESTGKYAFFVTFVPTDSADVLQSFVQMGADLLDAEGNAAFDSPQGRAVFQYWTDLYQQGLLPREVLTQGHRRGIELFQAGETALLSSGPQFLKTIETNAPAIAQVTETAPQITGNTAKKSVAVMNVVIPRNTPSPEEAVAFALYLTNNANQLEFAKAANVLPSTQEALTDPYFTAGAEADDALERAKAISAAQMTEAEVLLPPIESIKELQRIVYDHLQAAMLGELSVDEAATRAAAEWDAR
ncbi:MAG: sugar ABC transporter substrate-binding protein [Kaiparowitsia implicata GSE-PSE-MK54-09C]|nr:sugar ABC transporter substrate-binding protein [Kaiparowitsia implicata GSE-PSE-MK54-09C]